MSRCNFNFGNVFTYAHEMKALRTGKETSLTPWLTHGAEIWRRRERYPVEALAVIILKDLKVAIIGLQELLLLPFTLKYVHFLEDVSSITNKFPLFHNLIINSLGR